MTNSSYHPFRSEKAKAEYLAHYDESVKHWGLPSECKMVDSSFGQTFVRVSGPDDAPALVLFHGAGSSSLMWSLNIKALSENYRTYAVDSLINTGCVGRSIYSRPIRGADDVVKWLDELFSGLKLSTSINLVGVSYGAWLASQYVLQRPERLNKVVLLAPAGTVLPFSGSYLLRTIFLSLLPFRFTYRRFFSWSFPDLAQKDRQFLEAMVDEFLLSSRCFVAPNLKESPRLSALRDEELQSIHVPTLVLIGENEVMYSAQEAIHRLKEIAPKIQAEIIPKAGHDLLLVQMELVHQKILSFLDTERL